MFGFELKIVMSCNNFMKRIILNEWKKSLEASDHGRSNL